MDTKVTTSVIVNDTKHGLTMKVGNRNFYARLTSVKNGVKYEMQIDNNWTFLEFLVQDKCNEANHMSSLVRGEGGLEEYGRPDEMRRLMSDPDHFCKNIPCSYCGKDWPKFPSSDD